MIVNPVTNQKILLSSEEGKALLKQYIHSYNQQKQATLQTGGSTSVRIPLVTRDQASRWNIETMFQRTRTFQRITARLRDIDAEITVVYRADNFESDDGQAWITALTREGETLQEQMDTARSLFYRRNNFFNNN